jgi:hypothetical protein
MPRQLASTWEQVSEPWNRHTATVSMIALNLLIPFFRPNLNITKFAFSGSRIDKLLPYPSTPA